MHALNGLFLKGYPCCVGAESVPFQTFMPGIMYCWKNIYTGYITRGYCLFLSTNYVYYFKKKLDPVILQ